MILKHYANQAASLGILFVAVVAGGAQDRATDPAHWVPVDALVYVGITDPAALVDGFEKTAAYALLNAAAGLDGPLKRIAGLGAEFRDRLSRLMGAAPEALLAPRGPIAFYLRVPPGGDLGDARFVLIFGIESSDANRQRYAAALDRLSGLGRDRSATNSGAWKIDILRRRVGAFDASAARIEYDEDVDPFGMASDSRGNRSGDWLDELLSPQAMPDTLALCLAGDRVIVSDSVDEIKAALHLPDDKRSLAAGDDYRALLRHFASPGPLRVVIDFPRMLSLFAAREGIDSKVLTAWGADSFGSLIAHAEFGRAEFDLKAELMWLGRGKPTGALSLLRMENRPNRPPEWIPADAAVFASLNLDPLETVDRILQIVKRTAPEQAEELRLALEQTPLPAGQTLNFREEILGKMKPPLTLAATIARPYGPNSAELLFSIGNGGGPIGNDKLPPGLLMPREVGGGLIYDAPIGGISVAETAKTHFGGSSSAVERALSPSGALLANGVDFRRAAALVPSDGWLLLYADVRGLFDGLLALLEQRERLQPTVIANVSNLVALAAAEQLAKRFGDTKPAEIREITRCFGPIMATCRTEPDGIRLTCVALRPRSNLEN